MRKVFSGGFVAATLGAALFAASAMPAFAQKDRMSGGSGTHVSGGGSSRVSGSGNISGGGRVSSGAQINSGGRISGATRDTFRTAGVSRNNGSWDWRHRHGGGDRDRFGVSVGVGFGSPYYAYGDGYYGDGYYDPGYYAYGAAAPEDDAVAYCMSRFQSYDPDSGTYLGFDGLRHPCP